MWVNMYDRQAAVGYARRWAMRRNPLYYDFDGLGGDCTNFVSQCVYAGAQVMNYAYPFGWFYRDLSNRSPSWTGVAFFCDFMVSNHGVGPFGKLTSLEKLLPGDVIQLGDGTRFYHSLLVVDTVPQILVAAHTNDVYGKPLSEYFFAAARGIHVEGVRIMS